MFLKTLCSSLSTLNAMIAQCGLELEYFIQLIAKEVSKSEGLFLHPCTLKHLSTSHPYSALSFQVIYSFV